MNHLSVVCLFLRVGYPFSFFFSVFADTFLGLKSQVPYYQIISQILLRLTWDLYMPSIYVSNTFPVGTDTSDQVQNYLGLGKKKGFQMCPFRVKSQGGFLWERC